MPNTADEIKTEVQDALKADDRIRVVMHESDIAGPWATLSIKTNDPRWVTHDQNGPLRLSVIKSMVTAGELVEAGFILNGKIRWYELP